MAFGHRINVGFAQFRRTDFFSGKVTEGRLPDRVTLCTAGDCQKAPTHYARYDYITGRGGRVSRRDMFLCDDHAVKFAKRYRVEIHPSAHVSEGGANG